jgi:galactose mutarotase-like enzyme
MGCRIHTDWSYRGFQTIVLENRDLRVIVLPEIGAKIFEFKLKKNDRDLLYHNPRVEIRMPVYGTNVDNWWHGGIDECIPTGAPTIYKGDEYPYLGELWSMPWNCEIERNTSEEVTVHLWRPTVIATLLVERWMTLRGSGTVVEMNHRITNTGYADFQFLWGIHPALAVNSSTRIDIPSSRVIVSESSPNNRLGLRGQSYSWPYAKTWSGKHVDMRNVPPANSQTVDMHFATAFAEGWLAVTDTAERVGFGMAFPKDVFKSIWMWLVYGGWRGLYCVAIEPWTGYPSKLDEAIAQGECTNLKAAESICCETRLVGYTGFSKVERIRTTGEVEGT